MCPSLDPESVDLADIVTVLRNGCGAWVEGEVVGRTRLRDEVVRHLGCSLLEGESLIDTMIGRGFIARIEKSEGLAGWSVGDD